MQRRWAWLLGIAAMVLVLAYAIAFLIDEPLRRLTERQMNARMTGYTARIGHLDFHPIGFAVDLRDVVIVQDAHPDPPVLRVPRRRPLVVAPHTVSELTGPVLGHRPVVEGDEDLLDDRHVATG